MSACSAVTCGCALCLSYLVEAHTVEAGDPGEGGVASSFSRNERGRYTSVPLPGLDTHGYVAYAHTRGDTGTQEES